MKNASLRKKRWRNVILFMLVIYGTLYITRPICSFLRDKISNFDMLVNISLIVAATAAFSICYRLRRKELITKNLTFLLLSVVIFIYSSIIWQFRLGEEKIHFIEYGILGFLIYRAFCVDIKGVKAYIYTLLLGSVAGWVDEAIQHILPNRYYELKDVLMNTIGVAMGLIIIFIADLDKRPILKFYRKR